MQKKEKTLVAVTIVMVAILIVCLIYDRNSAVLRRTLPYSLPADTKLVDMDKHGFMFYRVGYEARVEIDPNNPEELLTCFFDAFGDAGEMLSGEDFAAMENYMFEHYYSYADIRPAPAPGSHVWMQEADIGDGHHVLHFIDIEAGDHAYLYIYYVR